MMASSSSLPVPPLETITSGAKKWSPDEEVILMYYASRGVRWNTIKRIMEYRCPGSERTHVAASRHKYKLSTANNLRSTKNWRLDNVDKWIDMKQCPNLASLIAFDDHVHMIFEEVTYSFQRYSPID